MYASPFTVFYTPQPLRAVGVLFLPMVFGKVGGWKKIVRATSPCGKLILDKDIGWGL